MTKAGYKVKVWSQDEKNANDNDSLMKLNTVMLNMSDNPKLREVYNRKLLEFADLTPEEVTEIMQFEKQKLQMLGSGLMGNPMQPGQPQPQPQPMPQMQGGLQ